MESTPALSANYETITVIFKIILRNDHKANVLNSGLTSI